MKIEAVKVFDKCRANGRRYESQTVYNIGNELDESTAVELIKAGRAIACDPVVEKPKRAKSMSKKDAVSSTD